MNTKIMTSWSLLNLTAVSVASPTMLSSRNSEAQAPPIIVPSRPTAPGMSNYNATDERFAGACRSGAMSRCHQPNCPAPTFDRCSGVHQTD